MSLYPLGISRCQDVPSVPKQAAGSVDMRWSLAEELACAFIDAPHQAVPPMLHAAVLDAIHRRICVLPVRFGVALRDEGEIRSLLHDRRHELLDHLSRLDRTCEMGVQIAPLTATVTTGAAVDGRRFHTSHLRPGPHTNGEAAKSGMTVPSNPPTPLAYLEQRRSHYRRADEDVEEDRLLVQQFVERLDGCYRQWRKLPASPSHRIRLAFLVERDRVAAFQGGVETARKACPQGRCVVLGPWPPYSFVETPAERLHTNAGGLQGVEPMQSTEE
jgi:hypothetical protein